MPTIHEPVLLKEVIANLNPQPGDNFIDCTFGGGGHSLAILEKIKPNGRLLGIDWDNSTIQNSKNKNLILVNGNYKNIRQYYDEFHESGDLGEIKGILLDLGLSSDQLADEDRGFSFESIGRLDMRFDSHGDIPTAADILMKSKENELARIFEEYGEEPLAKQIAKAIVSLRQSGKDVGLADVLVGLISDIYRRKFRQPSRKHPATRVLQALRIAVNDEFGNIRTVLPQAIGLLSPGGRLAVISFHSGEDRLVKNFFRDLAKTDKPIIKLITKKPIIASEAEEEKNPRSRSAKMRVIEKIK